MKKGLSIILTILLCGSFFYLDAAIPCKKKRKYKIEKIEWEIVKMDSTLSSNGATSVTEVIQKYKPKVDSLNLVIGNMAKAMSKAAPESSLSNLAADILLYSSNKYLSAKNMGNVDIAMLNFGGIRADFKKGAVTISDVFSVFPFDNKLVIVEIKGKYIKELFDMFAENDRIEPVSGIKVIFHKDKSYTLLIGGKPVEDEKLYKFTTVDFILQGGDGIFQLKRGEYVDETGILVRDAVIDYFQLKEQNGELIDSNIDGRVIFEK